MTGGTTYNNSGYIAHDDIQTPILFSEETTDIIVGYSSVFDKSSGYDYYLYTFMTNGSLRRRYFSTSNTPYYDDTIDLTESIPYFEKTYQFTSREFISVFTTEVGVILKTYGNLSFTFEGGFNASNVKRPFSSVAYYIGGGSTVVNAFFYIIDDVYYIIAKCRIVGDAESAICIQSLGITTSTGALLRCDVDNMRILILNNDNTHTVKTFEFHVSESNVLTCDLTTLSSTFANISTFDNYHVSKLAQIACYTNKVVTIYDTYDLSSTVLIDAPSNITSINSMSSYAVESYLRKLSCFIKCDDDKSYWYNPILVEWVKIHGDVRFTGGADHFLVDYNAPS